MQIISDMLQYQFMQNAALALLLIAPIFGLIGTIVVNNKMSFFSDALGHSALTGVAIGAIIGLTNYSISMVLFAVIFALILNFIKSKNIVSTDTIISVMSSTSIALGLALLSNFGGMSKYQAYLVGDILSITKTEILILLAVLISTFILFIFIYNKLVAINTSKALAKLKNINTHLIDNIFVVIVAIIVTFTIKAIGILIINALLILPAAISRNVSCNMRQYTWVAILSSTVASMLGLILSFAYNIPTGPMIVIVAAVMYVLSLVFKSK